VSLTAPHGQANMFGMEAESHAAAIADAPEECGSCYDAALY
jgi:hypothetical protein